MKSSVKGSFGKEKEPFIHLKKLMIGKLHDQQQKERGKTQMEKFLLHCDRTSFVLLFYLFVKLLLSLLGVIVFARLNRKEFFCSVGSAAQCSFFTVGEN